MTETEKPIEEENAGEASSVETSQAPENRPTEVEGSGSKPEESNQNGRGKGPDPYYANKRVTESLKKEVKELRSLVSDFIQSQKQPANQNGTSAPNSQSVQTDIWTDPDKWVDSKINSTVESHLKQFKHEKDREDAEQYVLSQDFIDPEADVDYLQEMSKTHGLDILSKYDPKTAAHVLLKLVKQDRGIGDKTVSKAQVRSVQGGPGASNGGKRVYLRREIKTMSLDDYEKNRKDIEAAYQEGRIKD